LKLPIIAIDGLDCVLYDSVEAAESHLEPGLSNNDFDRFYDARGRRIHLRVNGETVSLELFQPELDESEQLKQGLHDALEAVLGARPSESTTLDELIESCRRAGFVYR
jgi:hypothetical protein